MSEHDYVIANAAGATIRADFNSALAAIVSNNSKATEPTATFAYMWWPDTTTSILKMRNADDDAWIAIGTFDQTTDLFKPVSGDIIGSSSTKTAAYTVLSTDITKQIILGSATAADRTFTLPSVGSDDDGMIIHFLNDSDYTLTLTPSDSDSIWNSGEGYGIEATQKGCYCSLRYDHAITLWIPIQVGGGLWIIEGLKLHVLCTSLTMRDVDQSTGISHTPDISNHHLVEVWNGVRSIDLDANVYPTSLIFGGSADNEWMTITDHTDFDIFNDNTQDVTLFLRCFFDIAGLDRLVSHYASSSNFWRLYKDASDHIAFDYTDGGTSYIAMTASATLSTSTWYNVAFIRKGTACGLYIGTGSTLSQIAFDNVWTEGTTAGDLYFAQAGDDSGELDGKLSDIAMMYQNIFNANPVVGLTDTITVPNNHGLNLVTGGI